jgi:hypothetical protein
MRVLCITLACCALTTSVVARAEAGDVRVTIISAKIDAKKLKGRAGSAANTQYSDLACLSLPGLRAIADMCGVRMAADGVTVMPPAKHPEHGAPVDPFVRLEIGDRVVRTYSVPGTLTPKWDYSVVLDEAVFDDDDSAAFVLYDLDAGGKEQSLGQGLVKFKEMKKAGTRTVKVGGATVTYSVERCGAEASRTYSYRVPADKTIADLARDAKTSAGSSKGEYVLVPVSEGEVVEVRATGKMQPSAKKLPKIFAGPNGIPTIKAKIQYNQPGFRGCAGCDHGALIGQLGAKGMVMGEHKKFTAENAGHLVLAINDLKTADNAGGYDVEVTVTTPKSTEERGKMKKKGSAEDSTPGMDPRVLQQIVDGHGAELDACVAAAKDPNGDIVLQFSISSDGSLLGVIVEKASPNLKAAGDCMRKKALTWKFPPPRGLVTMRYPLNFSAG